jgi:hypothetical protein
MEYKVERRVTEKELEPFYNNDMLKKEDNIKAWIVNDCILIDANPGTGKAGWAYDKDYSCLGGWKWEDSIGKAIKKWEILHDLTPKTAKTFGDIIDEL